MRTQRSGRGVSCRVACLGQSQWVVAPQRSLKIASQWWVGTGLPVRPFVWTQGGVVQRSSSTTLAVGVVGRIAVDVIVRRDVVMQEVYVDSAVVEAHLPNVLNAAALVGGDEAACDCPYTCRSGAGDKTAPDWIRATVNNDAEALEECRAAAETAESGMVTSCPGIGLATKRTQH